MWGDVDIPVGSTLEFEPDDQLYDRYELVCAQALVIPTNDKIPVRLSNATNSDIQLYAGMKLGLLNNAEK